MGDSESLGFMNRLFYWLWRTLPLPKPIQGLLMWLINPKFVVGTAILVFNDCGEILLFKHTYRKKYLWGLPGGYMARGENPDQTIQRELLEESGLLVNNLQLKEIFRSREMPRLEIIYTGELKNWGAFSPSIEVSEARFFSVNHLPSILPGHNQIIKRYSSHR